MQTDYLFDYSESEIERIRRQAEMLRPITQRLLISAGLRKCMRVLDIGCGAGDVTMLVAGLVGPTGHVVGIDRDEAVIGAARRRINERGLRNVDFAQHDAETYEGPDCFDAAICRYVLIHQIDPVRFLRAAREHVRPGGIVAVHEMDSTRGVLRDVANSSSSNHPALRTLGQTVRLLLKGCQFKVFRRPLA